MVEIQTSPHETAELITQTQQEKISKAIDKIKTESKERFNNVNELINKNFFDKIEQGQAENIIKIIDNLFKQGGYNKDLKDLKEFLEPKAAKIISSFEGSNEYIADTKITLDINAKAQLQTINSQISALESRLGNNDDLKKIITELKYITNNLNERNKSQLITFLSQNGISNIDENTGNTELLQGVNLFLRNISKRLTDIDESNSILNERNENANRFNAFLQTINGGKRENLDNFNDKEDLQRLQTFIEQNPGNKNIMSAYLKMKKTQIKEQNNVHRQDRKVFENILNMLEKEYGESGKQHKEFQKYLLDEQFKTRDITESNQGLINLCKNGLKLNWDGNDIDNTENIQNFCKSRGFNVDQFISKFNEINQNRIKNNVQQLNGFNILNIISDEKLKKFTIETTETEGDGKNLQLKYNNIVLSAEGNNLVSTLGLDDKAKQQLKTNSGTNFIDENELIQLIKNNSDVQKSWYDKIFKKVQENQTAQADASETPETPEETAPEELKELNASDIKNVRKYVNAEDVAKFFNEAISKENLTDDQKEMLLLAQKGLVTEKGENGEIKKLQRKLGFSENAIDGKFGIKTFNALKKEFGQPIEQPIEQTKRSKINKNGSMLGDVTITADSIETEKNNLIKQFSLTEKTLDDSKMNDFGIDKNTKTFNRSTYTGIYYFDTQNILHYIPDLSTTSDHKSDKVALGMLYKNEKRNYENPTNTQNYFNFLKKNIDNDTTLNEITELKWDTKENTFCLTIKKDYQAKGKPNGIVLTQNILKMFDNPTDVLNCAYKKLNHNNNKYYSNTMIYWKTERSQFEYKASNDQGYTPLFKPSKIPNNPSEITDYFNDTNKEDLKRYNG